MPFLKCMSHINIKRKDMHKISVIFGLFTNLLQTYIYIHVSITYNMLSRYIPYVCLVAPFY